MLYCFRSQVFAWNTSYSVRNQPILIKWLCWTGFFFKLLSYLGCITLNWIKKGAAELMLGIDFLSLLWIEVNYSGSCRQSPHLRNFDSTHALFVHWIHLLKFSIRVILIYSVPAYLGVKVTYSEKVFPPSKKCPKSLSWHFSIKRRSSGYWFVTFSEQWS